ncbi:MAG: hypothetical protein M0R28_17970 [Pigmentiphaga sp.]|nr:hypothetical protein [Pigmentiphaga sp.]
MVFDRISGSASLWSHGDKSRSQPVLDVTVVELEPPEEAQRRESLINMLAGLRPLTTSDHERTQDHLRRHREAGGKVARAVGATLSFEAEVRREADALVDLLVRKNEAYGDSALRPVRIFSRASVLDGLAIRIDDKLSRIARGHAAGEDVEEDLLGYLLLRRVAKARERRTEAS